MLIHDGLQGRGQNSEWKFFQLVGEKRALVLRIDHLAGSALALELFGADSVARPRCSYSVTAYCYTYDRTEFDHALLTDPEQFIPSATLTRVSSENGDYHVLWAHSEQSNLRREPPLCSDGPIDASNTGFLAIRRD